MADIKNITLNYDDGTKKVIEKGFVTTFETDEEMIETDEDKNVEVNFNFVHISGREIQVVIESCLQLGIKLGMFGDKEE